jgi:hypothetical protein
MKTKETKSWAIFHECKLSAIKPLHWLQRYLENQCNGLTGHLESAGYPFDSKGWMSDDLEPGPQDIQWWHYEQYAYWVDGMTRTGHMLSDEILIKKAHHQIQYVLDHADNDGYLGPKILKSSHGWGRWPHTVFFRAMMAHHSATEGDQIIQALARHYLESPHPYANGRDVCNIEPMLWVYERTKDQRLLKAAVAAYQEYNRRSPEDDTSMLNLLSDKRATEHGVTYNEIAKLGAILFCYTGEKKYLEASINAYHKLDRDQMLVDGVCSSSEALRGKDPLDSHETCDIADYTWSVGYLLLATGDATYADKIERACFNAAPGAVREDFKALQYFSCPNQVIADHQSNHNYFYRGLQWMSYQPRPGTQCCTANVNRIIPNYVSRMWLRDRNGGIVAALYGPSEVTVPLGTKGQMVTIIEETTYPFSENINFHFHMKNPVEFNFQLRIPGWCQNPQVSLNGQVQKVDLQNKHFSGMMRTFSDGDKLQLHLPMEIKLKRWPKGGTSIERGPLVFALRIEEDWNRVDHACNTSPEFPAWDLYAASPWNYALAIHDKKNPAQDIEIIKREPSIAPWSIDNAPILLRLPARRVQNWNLDERQTITRWGPEGKKRVHGPFTFTPNLPSPRGLKDRLQDEIETVTLVPYGCTKLRIAIFPTAK